MIPEGARGLSFDLRVVRSESGGDKRAQSQQSSVAR
jgi:hypothetical protein